MTYIVCKIFAFVVIAASTSQLLNDLAGIVVAAVGAFMVLFMLLLQSRSPQVELANDT